MVRKRSIVWCFFKKVDSESVQCVLCGAYMVKQGHGTANFLRHLRAKHPTEVPETTSTNDHLQDMETDSEQFCSVEVALEDEDSDTYTTGNEAGINSIINGILEAADPAEQIKHDEEGDDRPVRHGRNKRSWIWRYYEWLDSLAAARCRICMKKLQCSEGSSTSNLHRHMSTRHPEVLSQLVADGQNPPRSPSPQGSKLSGDILTPPETVGVTQKRTFSVEVALEDEDSDTTGNEAGINSVSNGILEASSPAEQLTHDEEGDDRPVRRNKRSMIWRHYERLAGLGAARCRVCMKKLQYFEGGSTSNLHRHMSKRHPTLFSQLVANGKNPRPSNSPQGSKANGDTSTSSGGLKVSRMSEGEKRVFKREQELIEALRRAQREEARALDDQRELLEKLRAANAREAAAEREQIESLRKAQLEEAKYLSRQKEELQREKAELQKKCEELQQEREELILFSREQQDS